MTYLKCVLHTQTPVEDYVATYDMVEKMLNGIKVNGCVCGTISTM